MGIQSGKWVANKYNLFADEWDTAEKIPEDEMTVYEFSSKRGFIIPESNDGDDGVLYVLTPKEGEEIII